MTADAARKARRCFALAKSTTFPAERDTAIKRGLAILESAGLNPDHFDVPGRVRPSRSPGTAGPESVLHVFTLDDVLQEAIRQAMAKRHARVWRGEGPHQQADRCPHGIQPGLGLRCPACWAEAEQAARRRCRHGRTQCRICAELDGFGRL